MSVLSVFHSARASSTLNSSTMSEGGLNLIRSLNAREKRRFLVHRMLPVDAIDPSCSTRDFIEHHQTKLLYRYGCSLSEMNIEVENGSNPSVEKRKFLPRLRGFHHRFSSNVVTRLILHSLIFIYRFYWFSPIQIE